MALKTFLDYQVATSHNAYLPGNQICSCFLPSRAVRHVGKLLEKGVRMIELDVHEVFGDVVIAHGNDDVVVTLPVSLDDVFGRIASFMKAHPDTSPVMIDLELCIRDAALQDILSDAIRRNLSPYLFPGPLLLGAVSPADFLGRVIVLAGGVRRESRLWNDVNVNSSGGGFHNVAAPETEDEYRLLGAWISSGAFVRCYPRNKVRSTHADPHRMLGMGVHAVAMNYQTRDRRMKDYEAWFSSGGGLEGYREITRG